MHDNNEGANVRTPELQLRARSVERGEVARDCQEAMYALYRSNYADTQPSLFARDLAAKTHVVILEDHSGTLRGFSTLEIYESRVSGRRVRVIYSGDTIVDPEHWGSSALAFEWLRLAGETKIQQPGVPLYWLLIVKGHRTYRFLSTFAYRYIPHHCEAPASAEIALRDALAREKFGAAFDAASAIARFSQPQGRLTEELAKIPERHRRLAEVEFFLHSNPHYSRGDELVCLCELSAENLKPIARRVFCRERPSNGADT
jgi:hypothetical protein